eukprot:GGOE01011237.1.p1 GENE.GGOE01011237.1~~GGOE01011237.1.p1  ORF type:complete len:330 (-),score=55.58 GGOE01011237.1:1931-2890(-)
MGANHSTEVARSPRRSQTGRLPIRASQVLPLAVKSHQVAASEVSSDTSTPRHHLTLPDQQLTPPARAHSAFVDSHSNAGHTPRHSFGGRVFVSPGDSEDESIGPDLDGCSMGGAFYIRGRCSPSMTSMSVSPSVSVSMTISSSVSASSDDVASVGPHSSPFLRRAPLKRRPTPFSLLSLARNPCAPEPPQIDDDEEQEPNAQAVSLDSVPSLEAAKEVTDIEGLLQDLDQRSHPLFGIPPALDTLVPEMECEGGSQNRPSRPSSLFNVVEGEDVPNLCKCCSSATASRRGSDRCRSSACLSCAPTLLLADPPLAPSVVA